jgi:hypothetical protein
MCHLGSAGRLQRGLWFWPSCTGEFTMESSRGVPNFSLAEVTLRKISQQVLTGSEGGGVEGNGGCGGEKG